MGVTVTVVFAGMVTDPSWEVRVVARWAVACMRWSFLG